MQVHLRRLAIAALFLLIGSRAPAAESPFIYGIHDHDPAPTEWLNHVKQGSVTGGWITATVAVGHNPSDNGGVDFTSFSNQGHTVVCRINNGYSDVGTIPLPQYYADFAQRCANFVTHSSGCEIWVIGNETNLASEWPPSGGNKPYVSPQDYATCFRLVYNAIKAVRPTHKVVSQALAPFGGPYGPGVFDQWTHDGCPLCWVDYLNEMLTAIKNTGGLDGIALHINSRGYTYNDIHSTAQINVCGKNLYWSFYVYKDWINYGIPSDLYHLPLYATECNGVYYWKGGHPENPSSHYEPGWMQEIFAEINRWNQSALSTGKPIFRCVNMYRWCSWCDGWNIDGSSYKGQILSDLDAAVGQAYRWPESGIVVDNTDPGFSIVSGTWTTATSATDKYGADYRWNSTGTGADVARWTPTLPQSGNYDVSVWYPAGSNRANNSPFTVVHKYGSQTIAVNQQTNGGQWNLLGTFSLDAGTGGYVSFSDNAETSKVVVADAVRWAYKSPLVLPGTISGYVRDRGGQIMTNALVVTSTGGYSATTNGSGYYTISDVTPGTYTMTASKIAYCYQTVSGVTVPSGGSTTQDFAITRIGDNLLTNGNFEGGFQGSGVGIGWKSWTSGWSNAITFADSTNPVHADAHAQKWGRSDRLRVHGGICQAAGGVTPGRQYVVDGWIRFQATDAGPWAEVGYDLTGQTSNGEAASVIYTKLESGGQNTWLHYNTTVTATGSGISIFFKFGQYNEGGAGPSWAYADDASISEVPTPPVMVSVSDDGAYQTSATSIHGSWSASDPESGVIGYQYAVSSTSDESGIVTGGQWVLVGTATQATRTLTLTNGQVYYILAKARNPHNQWSAPMASDGIRIAQGPLTLSAAKKLQDGKWVEIPSLVCAHAPVSDTMAVRQIGNMIGIKVTKGTGVLPSITPGTTLTLAGRLTTNSDTRELTDAIVTTTGSTDIPSAPLLIARNVGGEDYFYSAGPPVQGQKGAPWGIGMNNVGLLVTVIGKVSAHGTGVFYLTDGSPIPGDLPVSYLPGVTRPDVGRLVKLTALVESSGLLVLAQTDVALLE